LACIVLLLMPPRSFSDDGGRTLVRHGDRFM
jgi:hypothetical protein